jgi:hypothetical protein
MSVRSQLRSYFSWPTEALLVGPDTSSPKKWGAWALSFVAGLGLGFVSCHAVGTAYFTSGTNDNAFSDLIVATGVLFIPLVLASLVLPRIGGPLLVLGSAVIAISSLPALQFQILSALQVVLVASVPMFLVGLGFTWSGLRPESVKSAGSH